MFKLDKDADQNLEGDVEPEMERTSVAKGISEPSPDFGTLV